MEELELQQDGIPSYGKIWSFGHRAVKDILLDDVSVQEKVDGSQISFGVLDGVLRMRSKGCEIFVEAPDSMFAKGVEYVKSVEDKLVSGWIYRGEYLCKPKHGALAYTRIPNNHIVLFDVMTGVETYLDRENLVAQAQYIGLEVIPELYYGKINLCSFQGLMLRESFLGGQTIEGIVVKNYDRFCTQTAKVLMAKHVSELFKEVHRKEWSNANPTGKDIVQNLIDRYKTSARWEKAVYRLRDAGTLENSLKDIGLLMKTVWPDVVEECKEDIMEALWKHFSKQISRGVTAGLPEWYKQRLLHAQFRDEDMAGPDYPDGPDADGFPGGDERMGQ